MFQPTVITEFEVYSMYAAVSVIQQFKLPANPVPALVVHSLVGLENRTESGGGAGLRGELIIATFRPKDICINRLSSDGKECVHAQKWTSADQQQAGKSQTRKLNEGGRQSPIPITKQSNRNDVFSPPGDLIYGRFYQQTGTLKKVISWGMLISRVNNLSLVICVGPNTPCGDTAVCPQVTGVSPRRPDLFIYLPLGLVVDLNT